MTSSVKNADIKLPKSYKEVSKLTKQKLKELCKVHSVDFEKNIGKKSLINIVCTALNIFTIGDSSCSDLKLTSGSSNLQMPTIADLQRVKSWTKDLTGIPLLMDESIVKQYLLGIGYEEKSVLKYKTLRAWEHKENVHSVKLRTDCSHVGAMLLVLCDVVAEGKRQLSPDLTCTDVKCSWSDPKGAKVEPAITEDINFYKAKECKQPPTNRFRPSPSVAKQYYRSNSDEQFCNEQKLKRALFYANNGKPMPPFTYISTDSPIDIERPLPQELSDFMLDDDSHLAYSFNVDVESLTAVDEVKQIVSPIKTNPASLHEIISKTDSIIQKLSVDDEKIEQIEKTQGT